MTDILNLENKLALITGGGTGLGLGIAKVFVQQGARVLITGRREEVLRSACEQLGENACYAISDITDFGSLPAFIAETEKKAGPIDILVNNAGIHLKKDALEVTDEEFEDVIRTNQQAVFALSREVAKRMAERGKGSIIMISSMAAQYGLPKVIAYTAAKTAIEGMTRALAVEWSPKGIRVNCLAPGFIQTEMSSNALNNDPERKNKVLGRTPIGSLGEPEDVGYAAAFMASDAAKYLTGVVLPVDGGNSIGF